MSARSDPARLGAPHEAASTDGSQVMCNEFCTDFGDLCLTKDVVHERDILEVGALNVNGSVKFNALKLHPRSYKGVDIRAGDCVDEICDANNLIEHFGVESFDVVITTEMMEHVEDWRNVINNLKGIIRPNGYILLTTRSKGFGYHGYPHDYWRYEWGDMLLIFADFEILQMKKDADPGISIFAKKPVDWRPVDLSTIGLYDVRVEKPQ